MNGVMSKKYYKLIFMHLIVLEHIEIVKRVFQFGKPTHNGR